MKAGIHPNYQPTVIKCACGATTVRTRLHRARHQLKDLLGGNEDGE